MEDKSVLLLSWIKKEKIDIYNIWRNSQVDLIVKCLKENKYCYILGLPRSGKTSTALKVGVELIKKFKYIRYLDVADLENKYEIDELGLERNAKNIFYIIDNWQARPEYHLYFIEQLKNAYRKGLSILIVSTAEYKENENNNSLNPKINPDVETVDSIKWLENTAKEMIYIAFLNKKEYLKGINDKLNLIEHEDIKSKLIDEYDYNQVLYAPLKTGKLDLRYLSWRLQIWQSSQIKLSEVTKSHVLDQVKNEIINPCIENNCDDTLTKIATVAFFKLPYKKPPNDPPLHGIKYMIKKKIVFPYKSLDKWRMDSSDAQLVIIERYGENFFESCIGELQGYLNKVPSQIHQLIWNISSISSSIIPSNTKAKMIANLFSIPDILKKEINYLDSIAINNMYGFHGLYRPIHVLFTDINKNELKEKTKRLGYISKLLTDTVVQSMGENAPKISFQAVFFFLRYLTYDITRFKKSFYTFFNAYGQDQFIKSINNSKGLLQKHVLNVINHFDIKLKETLKNRVIIKPVKRKKDSFQSILEPLMKRTVRWDYERNKEINFLLRINNDILENNLMDNSRKIYKLSKMLECSIWLSEASAIKIVQIIPIILGNLDLKNDHASDWRQLIHFSRFACHSSSRKITEFLTAKPISQSIETKNANELGFLLKEIEQGENGIISKWLASDIIFIEQAILKILENRNNDQANTKIINAQIDMILITLCVFAPDILIDFINNSDNNLKQNLFYDQPPSIFWSRLGILVLAGGKINIKSKQDIPDVQSLSECEPIQFIAAFYSMQKYFGILSSVEISNYFKTYTKICANQCGFSLAILISQQQDLLNNATSIRDAIKKLLFETSNQKYSGLQHFIYDISKYGPIECLNPLSLNREEYRDHVIAAALFEGNVRLVNEEKIEIINENPYNKRIFDDINTVLKPIHNHYLTIEEWDKEIKDKMPEENLYSWRIKLGKWEYIKWKIAINKKQFRVCFIENKSLKQNRF